MLPLFVPLPHIVVEQRSLFLFVPPRSHKVIGAEKIGSDAFRVLQFAERTQGAPGVAQAVFLPQSRSDKFL